jgi:hypothetical protein
MNNPTTELVFPPRLISTLRELRDQQWAEFIDHILTLEPNHIERVALELLIARWSGCANCQSDSFRAMQGCLSCASQAVRRFRGNDKDLRYLFSEGIYEIEAYINKIG